MASNEFIQSLISQLTEEGVKLAADSDKKDEKDKDKDKEHSKDEKTERDNAFRERMRRAKEKGGEEDEKKSASTEFDLLAGLEALPEDLRKLAAAEATSLFLADMARQNVFGTTAPEPLKQAGEAQAEADLFNEVFELHTAKLASLDPSYAQLLAAEQEKAAFNQGFEDAVLHVQQQMGARGFNQFGGF
jgi:hypothetical protein